jgi:hypothetical protein
VLAFFPLAFSPVCSHQLPELETRLPELEAAEIQPFRIDAGHGPLAELGPVTIEIAARQDVLGRHLTGIDPRLAGTAVTEKTLIKLTL